jgi:hypothetical protein
MAAMSCSRRPGSVPCERNAKATRRTTVNCHHMIGRDLPRTRGYTIPRHERDTCSCSQYITPLRSCKHNVLMRLSPCWTISHAYDGLDSPPNGKYRKSHHTGLSTAIVKALRARYRQRGTIRHLYHDMQIFQFSPTAYIF